jgi:beta-phosphoglucomutase-like phosphatase (HAD superfamily)
MPKIKAVIFDVDGVLLKSNKAYAHVFAQLGKRYGIDIKEKDVYPHFGEHPSRILKELFHHRDVYLAFRDYRKIVSSPVFLRKIKVVRGAQRALKGLSENYKLALISGALRISLMPSLKKFGFTKSVHLILSGDSLKHPKPNPEGLRKAMQKLMVKPHETLYVGDAPNDVLFAHRAGVRCVAVLTGVFTRSTAKKARADFIVKDVTKLEALLRAVNKP